MKLSRNNLPTLVTGTIHTLSSLNELRSQWHDKLAASGFEDIENIKTGALKHESRSSLIWRESKRAYLDRCESFYWFTCKGQLWEAPSDKLIWEAVIACDTISSTFEKLKLAYPGSYGSRTSVFNRIHHIKNAMDEWYEQRKKQCDEDDDCGWDS